MDFDQASPDAERLTAVLRKLEKLIDPERHPKLRGHDAIHAVLLVDGLLDDYTPSWTDRFPAALDRFLAGLANAKADEERLSQDDFWLHYGKWTRVNSGRGDNIARRIGSMSTRCMNTYSHLN